MSTVSHRILSSAVQRLRRLLTPRPTANPEDGPLLERFVVLGDQQAFALLVERHGPMVLGVCRRVLGDVHEAEDAFQATFLVLVRKARSIDRRGSVAGWLYTVAYHLALRAKANAARRQAQQRQVLDMPRSEVRSEPVPPELRN